MSFFEAAGDGGKVPPPGEYLAQLTALEIKNHPAYDNPEQLVPRAQFTFTTTTKDPETGEPYIYYEWTGIKYGNSKARLTELLDMMLPNLTPERRQKVQPGDICGRRFKLHLVKKMNQKGKEVTRLAFIQPCARPVAAPAPPLPPIPDDEWDVVDPFADELE